MCIFALYFKITIVTYYINECSKYNIQPTKYVLDQLESLAKTNLPTVFDISSNSDMRLTQSKIVRPTLRLQFRSVIPCLSYVPSITKINVSYQQMTDELMYRLLGAIEENKLTQQIEELNISGNCLSAACLMNVLKLFNNTNIKKIQFDDNNLKNSTLQSLQNYTLPQIEYFSLKNCNLRQDSLQNIKHFIQNRNCQIDLSNNDLNIQNYNIMGFIDFICSLSSLQCSLNIDNCKLSKYQIQFIQSQKSKNQQLNLSFKDNIGYNLSNNVDAMQFNVEI